MSKKPQNFAEKISVLELLSTHEFLSGVEKKSLSYVVEPGLTFLTQAVTPPLIDDVILYGRRYKSDG